MAESALKQVTFTPPQAATYQPNATKQSQDVTMLNQSDQAITFKWKSTRPGVYKMRPVYGIIQPKEKFTCKLVFKGLKPNMKCPLRDRFTCVLAIAPSNISNTQKMWTNPKFQEALANGEMKKKRIAVIFVGVNDHLPLPKSDEEDSEKGKKGVVKKGKGTIDQDGKGPAVVLMFRERAPEEDSKSDEEDDEDEKKPVGAKPGAAAGAGAGAGAKDEKKADGTPAAGTPGGPGPAPNGPILEATTAPMKNQGAAPTDGVAPADGAKAPADKAPAPKTPAAKTPAKK